MHYRKDHPEKLSDISAEEVVKKFYSQWCKDTKRNGGILIGSSIKELLTDFANKIVNERINDVSAEEILDKHYKPKMHWKSVNRKNVIKAMKEYAFTVNVNDPATPESTANWQKIGNKDKWLNEVRGREEESAEDVLRDKIDNHKWGYNYSNIESTE